MEQFDTEIIFKSFLIPNLYKRRPSAILFLYKSVMFRMAGQMETVTLTSLTGQSLLKALAPDEAPTSRLWPIETFSSGCTPLLF